MQIHEGGKKMLRTKQNAVQYHTITHSDSLYLRQSNRLENASFNLQKLTYIQVTKNK